MVSALVKAGTAELWRLLTTLQMSSDYSVVVHHVMPFSCVAIM